MGRGGQQKRQKWKTGREPQKREKKDEKGVLPAFGPDLCFW